MVWSYRWLMAVNSLISFSWMVSWKAVVRSRMIWLAGGWGRSAVVGGALLLFRLQTWLIGVLQIIHPRCKQGEFLVYVSGVCFWGSWHGLSVLIGYVDDSMDRILLERSDDVHSMICLGCISLKCLRMIMKDGLLNELLGIRETHSCPKYEYISNLQK